MKVAILVTIPENTSREVNTLCFDTLRTGFPTSNIVVYDNNNSEEHSEYILEKCIKARVQYLKLYDKIHHADWIKAVINSTEGKLCIIDPDTIWWRDVEWFDFPSELAGYYQPDRFCEFGQCLSVQRLHTHFLWIKDCKALRERAIYKHQHEYSPCNPYMPTVVYDKGKPLFYDTCAVLFHMIGGSRFEEQHLDCYDHVNSAALYNTLIERINGKDDIKRIHETAKTDPKLLKGLHKVVQKYELKMNLLAQRL